MQRNSVAKETWMLTCLHVKIARYIFWLPGNSGKRTENAQKMLKMATALVSGIRFLWGNMMRSQWVKFICTRHQSSYVWTPQTTEQTTHCNMIVLYFYRKFQRIQSSCYMPVHITQLAWTHRCVAFILLVWQVCEVGWFPPPPALFYFVRFLQSLTIPVDIPRPKS